MTLARIVFARIRQIAQQNKTLREKHVRSQQPANLAEWCASAPRAAATRSPMNSRDARPALPNSTSRPTASPTRLIAMRRQAGRAHRLSRQEQRLLFRAADGRDEGQCRDGAGELAARRPGGRLHRRRTARRRCCSSGPSSSRRSATSRTSCRACAPSSPPRAARRNGRILRPGAMRRAATIRRCRSARRTSRSSSTPPARPASRKARCCRTPTSSIWCRPATRPRSPTGTDGRPTTSRWWRCRSSISAAPAGA